MNKIILLLLITTVSLFAQIDEYKTDIYFGNGVWNSPEAARLSRDALENRIKMDIIKGDEKLEKKYGKVYLSYNWERGAMADVLETYYQLKEAGQVNNLDFFTVIYALTGGNLILSAKATGALMVSMPFYADVEQANVDEMLEKYYDTSFSKSHRVLLISHSQGNLFANRVYNSITPKEYQEYFANIQVATPAEKVNATNNSYITLFGDPVINPIPGSLPGNVTGDMGHEFISAYLEQEEPYNKLIADLNILLPILDKTISQWQTKEELNYGTKDYRIKVEHRFDPSVTVDTEVYPFDPAKKLYFVENPYNTYVKGGYGGTQILDFWEGQKENQFYKLEGTNPVEYIEEVIECKDPSLFEVIFHQNINTKDWRVTVKNNETNETVEGVYPFNLEGSLYQLESGEWVIASCDGKSIVDSWEGQKEHEVYKLIETNETIFTLKDFVFKKYAGTRPLLVYRYIVAPKSTYDSMIYWTWYSYDLGHVYSPRFDTHRGQISYLEGLTILQSRNNILGLVKSIYENGRYYHSMIIEELSEEVAWDRDGIYPHSSITTTTPLSRNEVIALFVRLGINNGIDPH
ncbi:hypothetical protein [Sulfurospirillum arcachonense]|uniref:hypothetical protein n=1 Tax=Sulfurospirillum arcachonense TaxID=57666 RepID=UPI00046A8820|nr:hypothetical protein [Sulfurospirillum arcachonense]